MYCKDRPAIKEFQSLRKYFFEKTCKYEDWLLGLFCIRKTTYTLVKLRKTTVPDSPPFQHSCTVSISVIICKWYRSQPKTNIQYFYGLLEKLIQTPKK